MAEHLDSRANYKYSFGLKFRYKYSSTFAPQVVLSYVGEIMWEHGTAVAHCECVQYQQQLW